jgi:3-dehydroquinate synthase
VVGADEREAGLRAVLNFGHTFGHAIETGLGYGQWLHGEAVACGMVLAVRLSARLGLVEAGFAERLEALVASAGLPVQAPPLAELPLARWFELMRVDKKAEGGGVRYILIGPPGQAQLRSVPDTEVAPIIEAGSMAAQA